MQDITKYFHILWAQGIEIQYMKSPISFLSPVPLDPPAVISSAQNVDAWLCPSCSRGGRMGSQGCKHPVQGCQGWVSKPPQPAGHRDSAGCRRCALAVPEPASSSSAVQWTWPKEHPWPGAVLQLCHWHRVSCERCGFAKTVKGRNNHPGPSWFA